MSNSQKGFIVAWQDRQGNTYSQFTTEEWIAKERYNDRVSEGFPLVGYMAVERDWTVGVQNLKEKLGW